MGVLLHSTKMRLLCLSLFSLLLFFLHKTEAEISGRTFGSCDTLRCMLDQGQAGYCCNSGRNRRCCSYGGGDGWDNGNYGGYNNNKPGSCPSYNGRYFGGVGSRPNGGYGNTGWNNGGSGYNPGYNGGWNNGGGRCIRDSECPGSLKCRFLYNGYQCTQPQYYG